VSRVIAGASIEHRDAGLASKSGWNHRWSQPGRSYGRRGGAERRFFVARPIAGSWVTRRSPRRWRSTRTCSTTTTATRWCARSDGYATKGEAGRQRDTAKALVRRWRSDPEDLSVFGESLKATGTEAFEAQPEPADRSRTVRLASTSPAPANAPMRAAVCTAMPLHSSPRRSHSPPCSPTYPLVDVEPMTGIEPAYSAWEADVLPLNYIGVIWSDLHKHVRGWSKTALSVTRMSQVDRNSSRRHPIQRRAGRAQRIVL
jgi:hypothetical protein